MGRARHAAASPTSGQAQAVPLCGWLGVKWHHVEGDSQVGAVVAHQALLEPALLKIGQLEHVVREVAEGRVDFEGTETWRTAYEKLLKSPEVREYRWVA